MPAIGNIVLNDAEGTPVAHTFAPVTTDGATAKLANRSASTPKGFETLSLEMRAPQGQATAYRLLIGFNDPVEATVDGSQVVVRNNSGDLRLNFSPESTAQERKNSLKMLSNLLNHATTVAVVENLEPIY
jgi:hypothetical protein